jgi:hypothetical protein
MIRRLLLLTVLLISVVSHGQERAILSIPDIPGYRTLTCDFHMHAVVPDGLVWPTVRVDEAWRKGLDAIAITDHLETLSHEEDLVSDHQRASIIAREYAKDKDVVVIAGAEISKPMPPCHLNALFIQDANPILREDFQSAVGEAARQGAFIMWNHPGWKEQQPGTMTRWDEPTCLYDKGWLHGIEVANDQSWYPEAIDWALGKDLAILGSSEVNEPAGMAIDLDKGHRTYSLVFATEKSEGAIREALFNGRTLAYIDGQLIGKNVLLEALLKVSLDRVAVEGDHQRWYLINPTDLPFQIKLTNRVYQDWTTAFGIEPHHEYLITLPAGNDPDAIDIEVLNFHNGASAHTILPFLEL